MIFYFSGTGNSKYIAYRLAGKDEEVISIVKACRDNIYSYTVKDKEKVGFVFPVYFYTVPTVVRDFVNKLEISNSDYVYSVITCGGGIGRAGAVLGKILAAKGIELMYNREVLMPDNSMLFYQIPGVEGAENRIDKADIICNEIKEDTNCLKKNKIGKSTVVSDVLGMAYKACMNTAKFYADEKCISCGLCEKNCPEAAIEIMDGKPSWVKSKCCKCSSCINRCPVKAIQYGKKTAKRNRYINPRENNAE